MRDKRGGTYVKEKRGRKTQMCISINVNEVIETAKYLPLVHGPHDSKAS